MASITREALLDATPAACWGALRDFGALHERLVPGFVTDTDLIGPRERRVTFFTGSVVTEKVVSVDEDRMRLVYTLTDGLPGCTFYGASAQIVPDGEHRCRFVWTVDVLPDELEPRIAAMMDRGIEAIERTLGPASGTSGTPAATAGG
jgi:Polyketide cyclase / dehydrase and lipid transport